MTRQARNYYELLGVSPDASPHKIQSAYRRLARRYHPDLNAGGDAGARFNELTDAYEVLHDPAQRARYDRSMAVESWSAGRNVPVFSAEGPARDVPRFIDEEPGRLGVRFGGRRGGVRVQLVVRWLR
jgi:DnaJ-class molecular chaperone